MRCVHQGVFLRIVLGLALAGAGCHCLTCPQSTDAAPDKAAKRKVQRFQVKGVVREVKPDGKTVVIQHEAIPGYMAAMTMPFDVKDPREVATVHPADAISFRLTVTETEGWIDHVAVLPHGQAGDLKPQVDSVRVARVVPELKEGDRLPDYRFINEQGQPVLFSQFRGEALGLAFLYTRCPYPTFCPRQSSHFAEVGRRLKALRGGPANWHLLSLSFDPAFDTPSVLRGYASQYAYDPARWNFLTGQIIDIDALTEQFGLVFVRDGTGYSHNVRTVVVDATGRIQRIFVGNTWTPAEFVSEMVKAAQAGR